MHTVLIEEFRRELPYFLGCSRKTAQQSAHHIRLFFEKSQWKWPACFTSRNVLDWLDYLASTPPRRRKKSKREASTVNGHLKSLKRFARWAVARGHLNQNPISHLRGLTERDRVILAPDPDTVRRLVDAALDFGANEEMKARNYAMLCMLADTGVRAGEMAAMTLADLSPPAGEIPHLDRQAVIKEEIKGHIIVHGKNDKDRIMALNVPVLLALMDYLPLRRASAGVDALWLTDDGAAITYEALRGVLHRIRAKAGVTVALHDLRRFTHTRMWLKGTDLITAMYLAGHSSTASFLRYIRSGISEKALEVHRANGPVRELVPVLA